MTVEEYREIVDYLRDVIKDTPWEGHVFTVGGCCRDAIMHHDIHDVDLAVTQPDGGVTFALWLEKQGLTLQPPTLYRRFSTSKLRLKAFPEHEIEIVQTRCEQYTDANSRNPEVCFGTIKEDCDRRDLTINSLYEDISTGQLLDLTGRGVDDIKHHRIDTPMDPDETYSDDPIRILRTLRFAVRYGWDIPQRVMESMKRNAHRMKIVRRPRVATEFEKIILSNNPVKLLKLMKEIGVIFRVLPELAHLYRAKDHSVERPNPNAKLPTLWEVTLDHLANAGPTAEERFAALFTEFHKVKIPYPPDTREGKERKTDDRKRGRHRGRSAIVKTALRRLMYDPEFVQRVKALLPPVPPQSKTMEEGEKAASPKGSSRNSSKSRKRRQRRQRARKAAKAEASRQKTAGEDA